MRDVISNRSSAAYCSLNNSWVCAFQLKLKQQNKWNALSSFLTWCWYLPSCCWQKRDWSVGNPRCPLRTFQHLIKTELNYTKLFGVFFLFFSLLDHISTLSKYCNRYVSSCSFKIFTLLTLKPLLHCSSELWRLGPVQFKGFENMVTNGLCCSFQPLQLVTQS